MLWINPVRDSEDSEEAQARGISNGVKENKKKKGK